MKAWWAWCALVPSIATAAPMSLSHQGRLLDASGGPLEGSHDVRIRLYGPGNVVRHDETFPAVPFADGYFTVVLGATVALNAEDFFGGPVLLGVAFDGGAELPTRQQLHSAPYAIDAGGVQLGNPTTCDAANGGRLRWTGTALEVCNGEGWFLVTQPGHPKSCKEQLTRAPGSTSGTYLIDPNGGSGADAFQVYCEMSIGSGGWTRIFTLSSDDGTNWGYSSANWEGGAAFGDVAGSANADGKSAAYSAVTGTDLLIVNRATPTQYIGWTNLFSNQSFQTLISSYRDLSSAQNSIAGSTIPLPWSANTGLRGLYLKRTGWNTGGGCTYNLRISSGYGGNGSSGLDPKGWGRDTTSGNCGNADIGYGGENPSGTYYFYVR